MPRQRPPSDRRLLQAAELKVGGASWDTIARQLNRSAETVRKWPVEYADRWAAALHKAERHLAGEIESDGILVLRKLLFSDDEKVRSIAARALINLRLDLEKLDQKAPAPAPPPPPLSPVSRRFLTLVDGLSHDDLKAIATNLARVLCGIADPEDV
jgi:hypothetical protein